MCNSGPIGCRVAGSGLGVFEQGLAYGIVTTFLDGGDCGPASPWLSTP